MDFLFQHKKLFSKLMRQHELNALTLCRTLDSDSEFFVYCCSAYEMSAVLSSRMFNSNYDVICHSF